MVTATPEQLQRGGGRGCPAMAVGGRTDPTGDRDFRTQVRMAQTARPTPDATASLVDTRLLGNPESFDGGAGWKDWIIVFRSYSSACSAPLGLLLERAERSADQVLNATLTQAEASCSTQLCCVLVMLCKVTALTREVNAGAQESLEAWRALVLHHVPTSLTLSAGLLQELLKFCFRSEIAAGTAHRPLRESQR